MHALTGVEELDGFDGERMAPFWNEGVAVAYAGGRTRLVVDVSTQFDQTNRHVIRETAGHFVGWVREEFGTDALVQLMRGDDPEQALMQPIEDAVGEFEASVPWYSPGRNLCQGPQLLLTAEDPLVVSATITCDDESTIRPFAAYNHEFTLQVEESGTYLVETDKTSSLGFLRCEPEPSLNPVPPSDGDIRAETDADPRHFRVLAGHVMTIELREGVYDLQLGTLEEGVASVVVSPISP